jgi:hypothetical protein
MKRYGMSMCALACFTALSLPCIALDNSQNNPQNNPWNGSWKIDKSTMKYDGPIYSVATDPDGYTLTRGNRPPSKVVCDGKPNAPDNGTTTTCNKVGTGYELENMRDGKLASKVKIEISPDGQTLTRTVDVSPPEGSPFTITLLSKKVSGGDGAPTVGKETSFNESQDTGVLTIQVNGDSVDFKETDNDKPITAKLDGTPTTTGGTGTMSVKLVDPHTLKVTYSDNGKVQRENTFVLGPDGKTITETDVTPEPAASTMSVMFNKS